MTQEPAGAWTRTSRIIRGILQSETLCGAGIEVQALELVR
jgi:hypothetical protein